jgi:hypothetical protein
MEEKNLSLATFTPAHEFLEQYLIQKQKQPIMEAWRIARGDRPSQENSWKGKGRGDVRGQAPASGGAEPALSRAHRHPLSAAIGNRSFLRTLDLSNNQLCGETFTRTTS